ncbi:hypothetical protein AN214_01764 [Pseudoalteromonas sp. P1-9]|uniref:PKD domain-containing protein n=1 Tax=Pseudoalteromonas sp. P1-9 TaxID=1710354 RepID=UPI0006D64C39|nr:hypothetical protein [Pseudoalteromonas sp. P1-9]KPV96167.1 hypothetical protein AN214_01764 [Pseudoalteromonas sp. P1-9]
MHIKKTLLAISLLTLITACGSDNESNSEPEIGNWTVTTQFNWGDEFNETLPTTINPNVSDPDGDALTYQWRLLSESDKVTLTNTSAATLSFDYPMSTSEDVYNLAFELTVTDEKGASVSDTFEKDFNDYVYLALPNDVIATVGQNVTITPEMFGRLSYISHYQWQVSSEHDIELIGADTNQVSFITPHSGTPISLSLTATHINGHDEVHLMEIPITQ